MSAGWALLMLPAALVGIALTGAPAFAVLIGVALVAAGLGVATGSFDAALLQAVVPRLIGLLEHDLLQALALYALVGALLQRLSLASLWVRGVARWVGVELATVGLAVLTAPLNGSVGASLALLRGATAEPLRALAPERRVALLAVAATLGVVVPPSLVLLLLGDALLRAHTEALQQVASTAQVINTGVLVKAALLPMAGVVAAVLGVTAGTRSATPRPAGVGALQGGVIVVATVAVLALVIAVAAGWALAVEAAALAGVGLWLVATLSGRLRGQHQALLSDAMSTTGLVFGLLVGATCFSLVLRGFGADAWLTERLAGQPPGLLLAGVLGGLLLCGFVLDAFEIIFLLVPIVMPPLLKAQPHAAWVGVLTLLALQIGYLIPPLGFAVLMARGDEVLDEAALRRALAPYLLALGAVLVAAWAWPALCGAPPQLAPQLDPDEVLRRLEAMPR